MEDFCDRIPGQHTGRLSLEHQAREAAEWQRKVDDLQKQLDSANRIIRIKNETISLLEKRCDNLREELDERADTIAVLHKTILEKNEAIRNMQAMNSGNTQDPPKDVHPMCAAMSRTQLKYIHMTHDDSNSVFCLNGPSQFSFGDYPKYDLGGSWPSVAMFTQSGVPLPPCPKCGAEPMERCVDNSFRKYVWIQCTRCPCRTYVDGSAGAARDEWRHGIVMDEPATGESPPISPEAAPDHGPVDIDGTKLVPGTRVLVHFSEGTREGVVVRPFPEQPTSHQAGCWVDVSVEGKGPEGIPSYILEVVREVCCDDSTTPATPSAAVGASGPVAECSLCNGDGGRPDPTFVRWHRCVRCEGTGKEPSDSKPTNTHNPESEDTPPHNPVLGPVVGTATVKHQASCPAATAPTVPPEVGKRYMCRNGEVTGVVNTYPEDVKYPFHFVGSSFYAVVPGAGLTSWTRDGRVCIDINRKHEHDLIADYHEPEPSPPAESPDDWVTQDRVPLRKIDEFRWVHKSGQNVGAWGSDFACDDIKHGTVRYGATLEIRCRRKDLPVVPVESPALPSPWRPMTDDYPRDKVLWVARDDGLVYTESNPDDWPLAKAVAWMIAVTPVHPHAAPPVPKTRTCECEVPE